MKSNKQRRAEIMAARWHRKRKQAALAARPHPPLVHAANMAPVNESALLSTNSYGAPIWQMRGYYVDTAFVCIDCGAHCLWTAERQKWWYEVAKGHPDTTAVRCKPCRARERARKQTARAASEAGRIRKMAG